ncbi:E3 ubiquitin-protein ligase CCNB1IP1 homolog isoform X7 [Capsicum annuum]|uniref:E3 ubiquitin-protein ligase CCNB1IP1 homolog isoform X7 n=1 Tax=Capsicum annuum TaxID=4072 RepID=UPI0007BED176|nr:E3 ubiquitin-protein ligase CCNB1IP1 homolog isoform X7 [Capsicum annuum]
MFEVPILFSLVNCISNSSSLKVEMRCNACWRELEGQAITTTCGHIFCMSDASKILSNDAACPICDQVLSKSLMKPVDVNPSDEWINMVMAGITPQILMKSAYRSVMFQIGQKELEMQFKMNKIVAQCRQKCEMMQEKFSEKLEQIHTAYQKVSKKCQMKEQEIESLSKDKQELQEKFAEKSRQKRKLDEMYDQLRNEYDSVKRTAIQPSNFFSRPEPDLFANPANMMDNRDNMRKDWSVLTPETPGPREDIWPPARQNGSNSGPFDVSSGSPVRQSAVPVDAGNRRAGARPMLGVATEATNPSMTLRNLILSPINRPQLSRNRPQMFTF